VRVGSLFAGIGGFDLAARRVGWTTAWHSEIDPYACAVFAQHFPESRNVGDITTWEPDVERDTVDLVCGGFPCQDVSQAGRRAGIEGTRSGLWEHFARVLRVLRPRYAVVENVPGLRLRGMGRVLGDLATIGYDATWDSVASADVGAIHLRERVWIVACADAIGLRPQGKRPAPKESWTWEQFEGLVQAELRVSVPSGKSGGVAARVPNRVDRLKCLGNSIQPQVAEWIFRQIQEAEQVRAGVSLSGEPRA